MKRLVFSICVLLLSIQFGLATDFNKIKVKKFRGVKENTKQVQVDFANFKLLDSQALKSLEGKKIHHVDLVYTAYRESENFDQESLNKSRMREITKQFPQLKVDKPSWKWVEQCGATTSEVAKEYFHGFVFHYSADLGYLDLSKYHAEKQVAFKEESVNNKSGGSLSYSSGSVVSIPKDAVVYEDGSLVQGEYTLKYREFRNQADIAFSGIPMTYDDGSEQFRFNSQGMYEIRAEQDGKQLALAKPITVDFNCVSTGDDVGFYEMDDNTGKWKKTGEVNFQNEETETTKEVRLVVNDKGRVQLTNFEEDIVEIRWTTENDEVRFAFSDSLWILINGHLDSNKEASSMISNTDKKEKIITVTRKWKQDFYTEIANSCNRNSNLDISKNWEDGTVRFSGFAQNLNWSATNRIGLDQLSASMAGHTYPTLVKGLQSPRFGVFNCDQIYKVGKPKTISPKYVNKETGKEITDKMVVSLIDLRVNGSFSFHPNNVTMNQASRNVILLFTNDKKTYVISEAELKKVTNGKGSSPTLYMRDMTEILKDPNDLKKYLRI